MIISIGPAMRASFDAPIRLIESYQVKIPNERGKDAKIRVLQDLIKRVTISLYLLKIIDVVSSNIIPASVMLTDESIMGEI